MTVSVLLDGEESTLEFHDVTDNQVRDRTRGRYIHVCTMHSITLRS